EIMRPCQPSVCSVISVCSVLSSPSFKPLIKGKGFQTSSVGTLLKNQSLTIQSLFAAHVNITVHDIHEESGKSFPEVRDRQFDLFIDCAFEKTRAVCGAEPFLDEHIDRGFGDGQTLALASHLTLDRGQVDLRDLLHLILRKRREDHNLINAVPE